MHIISKMTETGLHGLNHAERVLKCEELCRVIEKAYSSVQRMLLNATHAINIAVCANPHLIDRLNASGLGGRTRAYGVEPMHSAKLYRDIHKSMDHRLRCEMPMLNSMLDTVLRKNLVLDGLCGPKVADSIAQKTENVFLCAEISDSDLPWDRIQIDW